jgi:hypothetical protein
MRHDPGLIATLEMLVSGERHRIGTDSTWLSMPKFSFGPRGEARSSIEEHIDARTRFCRRGHLRHGVWSSGDGVDEECGSAVRDDVRASH